MRILVDCTYSYLHPEVRTGIQRVTREIVIRCPDAPRGTEAIPVFFAMGAWRKVLLGSALPRLLYIQSFSRSMNQRRRMMKRRLLRQPWLIPAAAMLAISRPALQFLALAARGCFCLAHPKVEPLAGDRMLVSDYPKDHIRELEKCAQIGVRIIPIIYDYIPLTHPEWLYRQDGVRRWFEWTGFHADRLLTISRFVADEARRFFPRPGLDVRHFHLGADFASSPGVDLPRAVAEGAPYFLMVGTIEPRKGHAFALAAFESAWARGCPARLVILGRRGWMTDDLVARLNAHPERGS
ncbi:MAG: hypothetical protein ACK5XN_17325, partial [Bacteroidota bacterium]